MSRANHIFQTLGLAIAGGLLFTLACITTVLCAQFVEHEFYPVVKDFTIITADHHSEFVLLSGTMYKARNCRFIEVAAYSGDQIVNLEFLDPPHALSRAIGAQHWGPWLVSPDVKVLRIQARHQCHGLWDTTTDLIKEVRL